jgi:hypothetical protein
MERHPLFKKLDKILSCEECSAFRTDNGKIVIVNAFAPPYKKYYCVYISRMSELHSVLEYFYLLPNGDCISYVSASFTSSTGEGGHSFSRRMDASCKAILESQPIPWPDQNPTLMSCFLQPQLSQICSFLNSHTTKEVKLDDVRVKEIVSGFGGLSGYLRNSLDWLKIFTGNIEPIQILDFDEKMTIQ